MAGRKVFTSGEILTAADVNSFLMDQSVMVFDDDAARTTAIPTPVEGMVTYREDANRVEVYDGSAFGAIGGILQVVSTAKTDTFATTATSFTPITGLSASITLSSVNSKVLVILDSKVDQTSNLLVSVRLMRDATPIYVGNASGGRVQRTAGSHGEAGANKTSLGSSGVFLDSPASTSEISYSVEMQVAGGTGVVNRSGADGTGRGRDASSITLLEVAV